MLILDILYFDEKNISKRHNDFINSLEMNSKNIDNMPLLQILYIFLQ